MAAALILTALVPAQTDEQRLDAVREFKRYFRHYKEVAQQVEAIYTLKGMESVAAGTALVKLLDHKELEVRNAAMAVLGSYHKTATFQGLIDELPDMSNQDRRATLIEVLGRAEIREAVPTLVAIATDDRRADQGVKYQIARALGRIGRAEGKPALAALLQDSSPLVRMGAVDAVRELKLKDLAQPVIALLDDRAWQVQSAAVKALAELRSPDAIEPLIALMEKEGRLKEESADALFSITALDFGADPDMWARQWARLKEMDWRIPTDEELAKARETRKRNDAFYGKKDTTTFSGITTTSVRVMFVIDVSGSMEDNVVETEKFDSGYEDFQKLTIVKTELVRTIENLSPNTIFNIVAFATDLKPWKKYLVPANIVNKSSAVSWVKRLRPIGGSESQELAAAGLTGSANLGAGKTNTFKALMYPFGVDPDKPIRGPLTGGEASIKNKLDTVFFLSDGRPSTGKFVDTREILAEVNRLNEVFKITFHTIAIGDFQKDFLRDLAKTNGGEFVNLGR